MLRDMFEVYARFVFTVVKLDMTWWSLKLPTCADAILVPVSAKLRS